MPGIVGIIGEFASGLRRIQLERMVRVLHRERFYVSGSHVDEAMQIGCGWVAHQGSFAESNPVWNENGDIGLVFTGEEFADDTDIQGLRRSGVDVDRESSSYLVHWYEALGSSLFERLNGTFAGVVIDKRRGEIKLFNDRFGLSRLYVSERNGVVYFASEAKALLEVLPETRALDPAGLAEFASCGCALQNRTLFAGVSLLPAAACWTFRAGRAPERQSYFDVSAWEQAPRLDEAAYCEALDATFSKIVPKYLRGPASLGMSLTGGLDGRMIMASQALSPGALPCYTFGGTYRDCTDVTLARRVARSCSQTHEVISIDGDFVDRFAALADESVYVSDGSMDVTGAVELYANRLARGIAPVRLTGNYGSEILRSNVAFKAQALSPRLFNGPFRQRGAAAEATYAHERQGSALSFITTRQVPWHHPSRLSLEQSQLTMRSPYLDNELVALAYRAPAALHTSKTPALRYIARNAELGRIPTDRGLTYRRVPVVSALRNACQEFSFRAEYAFDYGMPPWLARVDHALRPLRLESAFLGRHKFYHFRVWYRDRLGAYLKDVLLDPRSRGREHLERGGIETLLKQHLAGTHNHTTELHQALSIELIHRNLLERQRPS